MILQVVKNGEMNLSELLKNIFFDWFRLVLANVLMFVVTIGLVLILPAANIVSVILRPVILLILFIGFTFFPVVMTFNQFSLIKSFQFFGRVWQKARREFLYLLSMVIIFKLMLFILAIQVAFIPGIGRPLGVSLLDAFSLVITLIMMVLVIRPLSILTAREFHLLKLLQNPILEVVKKQRYFLQNFKKSSVILESPMLLWKRDI
jgi:hypothetical protein